ncbi:MAG: efflux RND transporter permease subunit [Gammaproteobacteria bacterium]|nr:efflux RND transporter permease subunit [Gammaproteobacteria bacterium]
MNLARITVRRPVFTSMVTLIIVLLGFISLTRLQIDLLPAIELPTLTVRTQFEGADPVVMESMVTQIVEEIVSTVPGIEKLTSTSYEGQSSVKVSFGWGTSIDAVAVDVRATLEDEISELPDGITGPRVSKFDIDTFPVVILGISSKLNPVELTEIVEKQIRYRLARVPGVAQVDPWGGFNREVRVELDPARINAFGLSLDQIIQAIRDSNLDRPAGKIQQGSYEVTLRAPAEFNSLQQIKDTMIFRHQGAVITLGQIAKINDSYEKKSRIVRVNGELGLRVAIRKQPQANTVKVAELVLEEISKLNHDFPQIKIMAVTNQGNFIQRSIDNVSKSVLFGGVLAIFVLMLFLRSIQSTLVIGISIPISIIATFALLYFSGFTINLMTLGGLALGVGMMVDSSIVVLENIYRRKQDENESADIAAVNGSGEVASAVIAGTVTTLVIFLPLIFVQGVTGELFKELAYVIMFSLFCALLVGLGLLPVLAAKLLKNNDVINTDKVGILKAISQSYHDLLLFAFKFRFLTILLTVLIFVATLYLSPYIGTEFIPPSDEGQVRVSGEMEVGTHLDIINEQSKILEEMLFPLVPEAKSSVVSVMSSGTRGSSKARVSINLTLTPAAQRQRSNKAIANDIRKKLTGKIPGMKIRVRAPQGQFLLERILSTTEGITVEVRGYDLDTLNMLASQVSDSIEQIEGITDVELSRDTGIPQQEIHIDRAKAATMGISVKDILTVIETSVAGSKAGEYRVEGNSYRILVQLQDAENRSIEEILNLNVQSPSGAKIALRNLVSTERNEGPVTIERNDRQRIVKVSANVSDRDLGSVAADIQKAIDKIATPPTYELLISGNYEEQQQAFKQLIISLVLALFLVYMVLASQYESLKDPFIVMFSVPLASIGVILTLFLSDTTMNIQSAIGCIMLGGIVVNNAILLVDLANQLKHTGMKATQAIAEAGRRRLRPILMTTLTTILALLPLAMGIGEGADAQAPLARVVIGGLFTSTLITLVFIPMVYSLFYPEES